MVIGPDKAVSLNFKLPNNQALAIRVALPKELNDQERANAHEMLEHIEQAGAAWFEAKRQGGG